MTFSPNTQILASSSGDCTIKLWSLSTGECFKTLEGHTNWIYSVTFSSDGQKLASGSDDRTIKLWDVGVNNYPKPKTLHGHTSWIGGVAFSPDNSVLVSGSGDGIVKLWDTRTGECLNTFHEETNQVLVNQVSVVFSPDGQVIVSSGLNLKFWNVKTGECFKKLTSRPYENMNITGVKGLTEAEKATLKALGAVEEGEM